MRSKNVVAGLLVAVAASGASAMAAPAQADPSDDPNATPVDQAFLTAIKNQGVPVTSDAAAIGLAHSTCDVLVQTGSLPSALHHVKDETGWPSARDVGAFASFAVQNYCPAAMPARQ
jgi:uncharacterized protein DUF732